MVEKYKEDEKYWGEEYGLQPSWSYFAAHDGLFREIPAVHREKCGDYDPRRRPWFVAASSGPKAVVLVLDVSFSMLTENTDRMAIAKEAARTVIETLTVADTFAVISFASNASQVGGDTGLIRATAENKNRTIEAIEQLKPQGNTNFGSAFTAAFDALEKNDILGCNVAILFMTDGTITELPNATEVISLVNNRTEQLESKYGKKTTIFTYSLGKDADHNVTKTIACSTGGIWTPISDIDGDLISAMSAYYKLFALGLGAEENEDFVAWVEPYEYATGGMMGTTVSVPVYDRNVTPHLFLGVVGIDIYMSAIEQVLGENATSSTMLGKFVSRSTASCPKIELSACELEALRFDASRLFGGGENATCGEVCNSTNYAGIVPETCPFQSDLPTDLWDNSDSKFCKVFVLWT
jgi:Mg-chelatase subunit ChlD